MFKEEDGLTGRFCTILRVGTYTHTHTHTHTHALTRSNVLRNIPRNTLTLHSHNTHITLTLHSHYTHITLTIHSHYTYITLILQVPIVINTCIILLCAALVTSNGADVRALAMLLIFCFAMLGKSLPLTCQPSARQSSAYGSKRDATLHRPLSSVSARGPLLCDPSITPHDQRQRYFYLLTVNYCCCLNYSGSFYVHSYELKMFTFTFTSPQKNLKHLALPHNHLTAPHITPQVPNSTSHYLTSTSQHSHYLTRHSISHYLTNTSQHLALPHRHLTTPRITFD